MCLRRTSSILEVFCRAGAHGTDGAVLQCEEHPVDAMIWLMAFQTQMVQQQEASAHLNREKEAESSMVDLLICKFACYWTQSMQALLTKVSGKAKDIKLVVDAKPKSKEEEEKQREEIDRLEDAEFPIRQKCVLFFCVCADDMNDGRPQCRNVGAAHEQTRVAAHIHWIHRCHCTRLAR